METENPARELLGRAFNPHIAVISSPEAQALCLKNNLTFTQLVSPFCALTTSLYWHEPNGTQVIPRYFRITPVDLASWKPPRPDNHKSRNRNILQSRVAQILPYFVPDSGITIEQQSADAPCRPPFISYRLGKPGLTKEYAVEVPSSTPWFDSWRNQFLKLQSDQQLSQHEFTNHFIGCIMVISSSEGKNADELSIIIGKLSKLQQQHQTEWPNAWFLPSTLKFYLILHDNSTSDSNSAELLYQSLRTTYTGNACYMLKVHSNTADSNSSDSMKSIAVNLWTPFLDQEQIGPALSSGEENYRTNDSTSLMNTSNLPHPLSPEQEYPPFLENGVIAGDESEKYPSTSDRILRGELMTAEDLQNIQVAVNEFIAKALLPYIERQTRIMHESIVNRRSMSKSFFGATKRLFGATSKSVTNVVYGMDSLEITSRKLADLYFLFGNYSGAYHIYHQLKKDFQGDQAWIYYASTLEMAALSHFAMTQMDSPLVGARSFPVHYVSEAIRVYLENCRSPDSAVRCALLCCECLKQLENYGEAASILIRMTSEDCDLRSALMLEQTAYVFLKLNSPRKYALHCVLAGHRYAKAGLRSHSLNSYFQAAQIFYGRGWRFAEDHVFFTIAKHQSSLNSHRGLAQHLKSLLRTPSAQPPAQTQLYYNEFLAMMTKLHQAEESIQDFFIPTIISTGITLRIGNTDLAVGEVEETPLAEDALLPLWDSLEEQVVKTCILEHSPVKFKPSRLIFGALTNNTNHPSMPANEFLFIEVPLQNPLSVSINLKNISLKFEPGATVSSTTLNELTIEPNSTKLIRFAVASSKRGRITYEWLRYELNSENTICPFQQKIQLKGPRLNSTKAEKLGKVYAKDFRNEINVMEQMPLLQAEIEDLPLTVFHSQLTQFTLILHDKSKDPAERKRVNRIIVASDGMKDFLEISASSAYYIETPTKNYTAIKLNPDSTPSTLRVPCLFKAPQIGDLAILRILIVYQVTNIVHAPVHASTPPSLSKLEWEPSHRVIQVSIKVPLQPCLRLEYSILKPVDSFTHLGLLKIHNLIPIQELRLSDFEFKPPRLVIEKLISREQLTDKSPTFLLGPAETRSIALQVKEGLETDGEGQGQQPQGNVQLQHHHSSLFLYLKWLIHPFGSQTNLPPVTGNFKLRIRKSELDAFRASFTKQTSLLVGKS